MGGGFKAADAKPQGERSGKIHRRTRKRATAVFLASDAGPLGSARLGATRRFKEAAITGIAVLFGADSARAMQTEKSSLAAPDLFPSQILPSWVRIPKVILAILGGMRENFVDHNIFWGGPQKSPPFSSSAPSPAFDGLVPSPPAPLPQGARGEGLTNTGRNVLFHPSPRRSFFSYDFFGLHPKKLPFLAPQKSQKSRPGGAPGAYLARTAEGD